MKLSYLCGITIPLCVCCTLSATAQDAQKAAPSVVVQSLTNDFQVAADGSNIQTLHVEVRASNDAGALRVSQTSISYDTSGQEVAVVDAHTLKADGKSIPVSATAIFDQAPPGVDPSMVTNLRAKLIVFPQFAVGDTAVYTVKITTKRPIFENQFFYGDLFLRTSAYENVRETITAPKSFPLSVESHDVDFSRREEGANVIYNWRYSAPKPLAEQQSTLSPLEHTPHFFASSFKDYSSLGRAYATLTEAKRIVTPKVQSLASEITAGTSDPKAQAQRLYEWVSGHIRYVAIELGTGSFIPHDVDSIISNGYGDCKDHDLLLQALLKAKGIEAESILINGSVSYEMTRVPTFSTLDHVITFVPQFNLYLDSTVSTAPFGVLPLQEYGKSMVIASSTSPGLGKMPLLQPGAAKINVKTVSVLDKSGTLTGTTTTTASGPYAINLRQLGLLIQSAGPTAATRILESLGYYKPSGSITQDSPTGFDPEYRITGTFQSLGWEENLSGKSSFYIPGGLRLFGQSGDEAMGPFDPGNMKRDEPTVCYSVEETEELSLKAPAGYQFIHVPGNIRVETPNLLFVAQWSLSGDTMSVHRSFTSKIDQVMCTGTVRTQSAAALKKIADSYQIAIAFTEQGGKGDKASEAATSFYDSGLSHYNAERYELAIADFDKAIALKPDDFYAIAARANAHMRQREYATAIQDYDRAIKLKNGESDAFSARGRAYYLLGQRDKAIADYSSAIALNPKDSDSYNRRGYIYGEQGQMARAIADFDKVIALDPGGAETYSAYFNRARANATTSPDVAMADLNKAIELKADFVEAYLVRGQLKAVTGKQAAAIADLDKALTLEPGDINILTARAYVYFRADNYKLAIADYDKVIAQKPDSAVALFYRGGAKNKLGLKKEGERDVAAALKLDPALGK